MRHAPTLVAVSVLYTLAIEGCSDTRSSPISPEDGPALAKSGTSVVSVKATNPAFGDQGQINETVTITGSGFKNGAQPAWLRNGTVDPTITVSSAQVVSSTTMSAVISIAPNSPLDFRDVQVTNLDRTQGIGDAVFEVTQAQLIPGTLAARGANDNGELTGTLSNGGVFYYNISTGYLQTVSSVTSEGGYDIGPLGNAIVGGSLIDANAPPYLYTRSGPVGTPWSITALPVDPKATGGYANAIASDPVTGQVTLIGGAEYLPLSHGSCGDNAVIWSWQSSTSTWQRIVLPKNGVCGAAGLRPRGLSANGTAVGAISNNAAVWTPNGSGGYTLTFLNGTYADGINANASMIVGEDAGRAKGSSAALYWVPSGSGWSQAFQFPGGCIASRDIANVSNRATLNGCLFGSNNVSYAAFIDPPYTTPMKLGGVGGHNNNFVGAISPSGAYMVGYGSTSGGVQVGVYWKP